jgi:hypothetical protein
LTFAIVVNSETHKQGAVGVIDRIVLKIVGVQTDDKPEKVSQTNGNQNSNANSDNRTNFVTDSLR